MNYCINDHSNQAGLLSFTVIYSLHNVSKQQDQNVSLGSNPPCRLTMVLQVHGTAQDQKTETPEYYISADRT